jgi:hypothetical protein
MRAARLVGKKLTLTPFSALLDKIDPDPSFFRRN